MSAADTSGWTSPYCAAVKSNHEVMNLLLAMPIIAVNSINSGIWTPLHYATREGHREVAACAADHCGERPCQRWRDTASLCCQAEPSLSRQAALSGAKHCGERRSLAPLAGRRFIMLLAKDIAKMLLAMPNISVNAAGTNGWAPLHYAAMEGIHEVAGLLLDVPCIAVNTADNHTCMASRRFTMLS